MILAEAFAIVAGRFSRCTRGLEVFPGHGFSAPILSLPIAVAFLIFLLSVRDSGAEGSARICENTAELAVLSSPIAPWKGAPLRVVFVTEKPLEGELSLTAPDGRVAAQSRERHGGPPYFWFAEVAALAAGTWRATLAHDNAPPGCSPMTRDIVVRAAAPPRPGPTLGSVWPLRNTWNRAT